MPQKNHPALNGMTLIEMMFALLLSLLLLNHIYSWYMTLKKIFFSQMALSEIQNNGREAVSLLSTSLHAAGYFGCSKTLFLFTPGDIIQSNLEKNRKPATDAITVKNINLVPAPLFENMRDFSLLRVAKTVSLREGEEAIISNCQAVDFFTIDKITESQGSFLISTLSPLQHLYNVPAAMNILQETSFFIAPTSRRTASGQPIDALYLKIKGGAKVEWVAGVTGMKIQYDVREGNHVVTLSNLEAPDVSNLLGVEIALNLMATGPLSLQKKEYTYVALRE